MNPYKLLNNFYLAHKEFPTSLEVSSILVINTVINTVNTSCVNEITLACNTSVNLQYYMSKELGLRSAKLAL